MNLEPLASAYRRLHQAQKLLVLLLLLVLLTSACSPKDERPGLWLGGEEATAMVNDWRFTDDIQEIAIETQTWYLLAHSTTIWCVEYEGNLYVGSYGIEKKFWEKNIERNPQAKINIDGEIYKATMSLLDDEALSREVNVAYSRKYDMQEVFGDEIPLWWFYRIEQQL